MCNRKYEYGFCDNFVLNIKAIKFDMKKRGEKERGWLVIGIRR